ncbi:MAG: YlxR family protein, partial [Firmicutes bacterium]|nr:YlxR family protein [Bacillota bacterium]
MTLRKQPLRQCVGCQQQREKRTMLRIVLATDGTIALDPTGRRAGRGA